MAEERQERVDESFTYGFVCNDGRYELEFFSGYPTEILRGGVKIWP